MEGRDFNSDKFLNLEGRTVKLTNHSSRGN